MQRGIETKAKKLFSMSWRNNVCSLLRYGKPSFPPIGLIAWEICLCFKNTSYVLHAIIIYGLIIFLDTNTLTYSLVQCMCAYLLVPCLDADVNVQRGASGLRKRAADEELDRAPPKAQAHRRTDRVQRTHTLLHTLSPSLTPIPWPLGLLEPS